MLRVTRLLLLGFIALAFLFRCGAGGVVAGDAQERGTIKGKVQTEQGKDFPGVIVKASSQKTRDVSTAATNSGGEYTLQLDPGEYSFSFDASGYQTATLQSTYTAVAGKESHLPTVKMTKELYYSLIKGGVFTNEGLSIAGAKVVIERLDEDGKPAKKGREEKSTNFAGSFAFRLGYAAGRYRITASMKGFKDETKEVAIEQGESHSISFRLQRREK